MQRLAEGSSDSLLPFRSGDGSDGRWEREGGIVRSLASRARHSPHGPPRGGPITRRPVVSPSTLSRMIRRSRQSTYRALQEAL